MNRAPLCSVGDLGPIGACSAHYGFAGAINPKGASPRFSQMTWWYCCWMNFCRCTCCCASANAAICSGVKLLISASGVREDRNDETCAKPAVRVGAQLGTQCSAETDITSLVALTENEAS